MTAIEKPRWGSYDVEAANEEAAQVGKSASSFMKLEDGLNKVRFLPPPIGKRSPFVLVQQHFVQLPGMTAAASFNCPRSMASQRCPACERADKMKASGNPVDFEESKKLFPKLRVYANVVNRRQPEMGPQVFAYGKSVHEKLVKLRTDDDAGGDFTDPEVGFDIVIEKSGAGLNTKYEVRPARSSTPLGDMEWLDMQQDLTRFGLVETSEQIAEKLGIRASRSGAVGGGGTAKALGKGSRTAGDDSFTDD